MFYAHSAEGDFDTWQKLQDHLFNVAKGAQKNATPFGAEDIAYTCGLLHDLGKYSKEFQDYLVRSSAIPPEQRLAKRLKKVDHSTAGGRYALEHYQNFPVLYAIAGHHSGLQDGGTTSHDNIDRSTLSSRLGRAQPEINPADVREIAEKFPQSIPGLPDLVIKAPEEYQGFSIVFFCRMLYSCLVDADYCDTELFCAPDKAILRSNYPSLDVLGEKFQAYMDKKVQAAQKEHASSKLFTWRQEILAHCNKASMEKPGIFSLTVPTGGGKTLSSLQFALNHAQKYGMCRIIYVIPFISIIDQTAAVFREALGDNAVLEHHSTYMHPGEKQYNLKNDDDSIDNEALALEAQKARLASENWDAPIIVTTAVQFFESLFANRSSACRKLHNIANSVVILDEAQMLPQELLAPTVLALRELSRGYRTSLVLCTATQPALEACENLKTGFLPDEIREIIPKDQHEAMFLAFKRVKIDYAETIADADLVRQMLQEKQVLCIVNTRAHAKTLFGSLGEEDGHFHLSARMYPAHRKKTLSEITQRLKTGKPCRVVSTQLVEAGVDLDFPRVFRAAAGLDSIAQAAGRCNREGRLTFGRVTIFMPEQGLPNYPFFQRGASLTELVMQKKSDFLAPETVKYFFKLLYNSADTLDKPNIVRDLHRKNITDKSRTALLPVKIPFKSIARSYCFIDNDTHSVIVECEDSKQDILRLEDPATNHDELKKILRRLQAYTVQIYSYEMDKLKSAGVLRGERWNILPQHAGYDKHFGLLVEDPTHMDPKHTIL